MPGKLIDGHKLACEILLRVTGINETEKRYANEFDGFQPM